MTQDDGKASTDVHEKARNLTEQALDKLVEGDAPAADRLIDKAKRLDPTAIAEVVEEMDEDAAARDRAQPRP